MITNTQNYIFFIDEVLEMACTCENVFKRNYLDVDTLDNPFKYFIQKSKNKDFLYTDVIFWNHRLYDGRMSASKDNDDAWLIKYELDRTSSGKVVPVNKLELIEKIFVEARLFHQGVVSLLEQQDDGYLIISLYPNLKSYTSIMIPLSITNIAGLFVSVERTSTDITYISYAKSRLDDSKRNTISHMLYDAHTKNKANQDILDSLKYDFKSIDTKLLEVLL